MGKLEPSHPRFLVDQAVPRPVSWLRPFPNNPRKHSDAQVKALAKSIKNIGWARPIASDESGTILYGHGCLEAAKLLGLRQVPVTILRGLSEAQKRALVIADNRLAELDVWDNRPSPKPRQKPAGFLCPKRRKVFDE